MRPSLSVCALSKSSSTLAPSSSDDMPFWAGEAAACACGGFDAGEDGVADGFAGFFQNMMQTPNCRTPPSGGEPVVRIRHRCAENAFNRKGNFAAIVSRPGDGALGSPLVRKTNRPG
jgi:hypothetical protein